MFPTKKKTKGLRERGEEVLHYESKQPSEKVKEGPKKHPRSLHLRKGRPYKVFGGDKLLSFGLLSRPTPCTFRP